MAKLYNRAKMTTATTGTGTITLVAAVLGYQTFATSGVQNGDTVSYAIDDNSGAWEYGTGTYSTTGPTLTRTLGQSSTGSLLSLSGNSVVYIAPLAADIVSNGGNNTLGVANGGTGLTSLTAGYIPYGNGTSAFGTNGPFWDATNSRLGIGITGPTNNLQVANTACVQTTGTLGYLNFANSVGTTIQQIQYTDTDGSLTIGGGSGGSYPVIFRRASSSESMRIDSSGNVGIGTSSPSTILQLKNGSTPRLSIVDTRNSVEFQALADNIAGYVGTQSNHPLIFYTYVLERARIDNSGNLLVGTTGQVNSAKYTLYAGNSTNTSYATQASVGGSTLTVGQRKTTSVSTTQTLISSVNNWFNLTLVMGTDGTNRFCDIVLWSIGSGAVNVISTFSASGSPATRTYAQTSSSLRLTMASGTYTVLVSELTMGDA